MAKQKTYTKSYTFRCWAVKGSSKHPKENAGNIKIFADDIVDAWEQWRSSGCASQYDVCQVYEKHEIRTIAR